MCPQTVVIPYPHRQVTLDNLFIYYVYPFLSMMTSISFIGTLLSSPIDRVRSFATSMMTPTKLSFEDDSPLDSPLKSSTFDF